ncbi:DUF2059 domain-containing protein [Bartonella tamiae]|uniref:DUF2059 domain-containing protein n=1 Tax=Bartonella tamiae Th239 TaxID=1094558 RepID=J0QS27_9HYPH|nr:DUF2059 domain-containing protein [Bartonella tamiae]EJF88656.1 hypothetical protein ME5_01207 [Bartonella tamiae Th239]EJF95094.1 hypothetical protein MEG_00675 [Bartonella tamiae Th307]
MNIVFSFRRLASVVGTVAVLSAGFSPAYAQEISDAHLQSARKAIAAIHATDQFDEFLPSTARDLKDELERKDPNLSNMISEIVDEQALALVKRRSDLEVEAARVYANHFSQAELDQIATFYESDTGKKLLSEGPSAVRGIISAFDVWSQGIAQDLATNVGREMAQRIGGQAGSNDAPTPPQSAVPTVPAPTQ